MSEEIKKIEEQVKILIEEGRVKMKPRWFFVLKSILNVLFILIVFLIVIYFSSFISFVMRERLALGFHPNMIGWSKFLFGIPWLIVILAFISLAVLEVLVRKYSFVYRRPLAYTVFLTIFIMILITFMLPKIDKKERFPRLGEDPRIPVFGPMHKFYRNDFNEREFKKFRIERLPPNFEQRIEIRFIEN